MSLLLLAQWNHLGVNGQHGGIIDLILLVCTIGGSQDDMYIIPGEVLGLCQIPKLFGICHQIIKYSYTSQCRYMLDNEKGIYMYTRILVQQIQAEGQGDGVVGAEMEANR